MGIREIRVALKNVLDTIPDFTGRVYEYLPGTQETPSITIVPGTFIPGDTKPSIQYDRTFGGTNNDYVFTLMIVVSYADNAQAALDLDTYLASTGTNSVKAKIDANTTLNGVVSYCHADRVIQYGALVWNGINYFGAQFIVEVNGA